MKILIDNVLCEAEPAGYVMGKDITGRDARASFHSAIETFHHRTEENFKVITSGHCYVFNYNPETIDKAKALTFEDYKKGIPL